VRRLKSHSVCWPLYTTCYCSWESHTIPLLTPVFSDFCRICVLVYAPESWGLILSRNLDFSLLRSKWIFLKSTISRCVHACSCLGVCVCMRVCMRVCVCVCVCVFACLHVCLGVRGEQGLACHGVCVETRGQLHGLGFSLSLIMYVPGIDVMFPGTHGKQSWPLTILLVWKSTPPPHLFILCVWVFVYVYICVVCACLVPLVTRRGQGFSGTELPMVVSLHVSAEDGTLLLWKISPCS